MIIQRIPIRVYWEDTDAGGIVYHSIYLNFAERGRTEFVRSLGISQQELAAGGQGFAFAVSNIQVDFKRSAKLDDLLEVETRLIQVGGASAVFDQRIFRQPEGTLLVRLQVRVGFVALDGGRPSRIPQEIRQHLQQELSERQEA